VLVDYLQSVFRVSIRRNCATLCFERSSYFYKPRRASQAALRKRIREIAETRVRYGYRRIHVLLRREGWQVNAKRIYRLYVKEGLQIRNKRPKRKVSAKLRDDRRPPSAPNDVWAMDFLSDQLFDGSKIRILTIVDAFSKLSPAIDVRNRYTGADVVRTLERVTAEHGMPRTIRVDQGPEFISKDLDLWAYMNGVVLDFSRPGKPTDNSFVEAFNGKVRAECVDQNWFLSLADAQVKCEAYRQEYNHERPHSSIGNKSPIEFMKSIGALCHPGGLN
jgi:putative transposase